MQQLCLPHAPPATLPPAFALLAAGGAAQQAAAGNGPAAAADGNTTSPASSGGASGGSKGPWTEISSSIVLAVPTDYLLDGSGRSKCMDMVDR